MKQTGGCWQSVPGSRLLRKVAAAGQPTLREFSWAGSGGLALPVAAEVGVCARTLPFASAGSVRGAATERALEVAGLQLRWPLYEHHCRQCCKHLS